METQNEVEAVELPADVQAELKAGHIVAFSRTESALATLRENYEGVVYDVATATGLAEAKAARKDIITHRTSLEKKRVEIKAPYLEYGRLLDTEAKRITAELESLENPIDSQIKAEEKRLADIKAEADRIEAARVNKHQNNLEAIRAIAGSMIGANLEVLHITLEKVRATKFSEYEEFEESARLYAESAIEKLNQLIASEQEKIAAKELQIKADMEAERVAKINTWLNNIQNAPSQAFGSTIEGMLYTVNSLKNNIDLEKYQEFADQAVQYRDEAVAKIESMIADAKEKIAVFERLQEESAEKARIAEIKGRIQLISSHALNLHRYPVESLKSSLQELAATELLESSFGEFFAEALDAKTAAIETMQAHIESVERAIADAQELAQMKADKAAADLAQQLKDARQKEIDEKEQKALIKGYGIKHEITPEEAEALNSQFVADIIEEVFDDAYEVSQQSKSTQAEVTRNQVISLVSDSYGLTNAEAENILKILFAN